MQRALIFFFLFLYIICASGLQPRNEQAMNVSPITPRDVSTSSKTTSTTTSAPLYLPVTTVEPDPLGMANISGLYGPGSWAGWFLTLVASWIRIIRVSEEKVDPNTVAFLFWTNWAAVDVWRGVKTTLDIPRDAPDYDGRVKSGLGSLGAALNFTFWGTFHAQIQLLILIIVFGSSEDQDRRLLAHTIGLVLPLTTLLVCFWLNPDTLDTPALYWYGMESFTHEDLLRYASYTGYSSIPIVIWLVYITMPAVLPKRAMDLINLTIEWVETTDRLHNLVGIFGILSIITFVISIAMVSSTGSVNWMFGILPVGVFLFIFQFGLNFSRTVPMLCLMSVLNAGWYLFIIGTYAIVYVSKAYLSGSVERSKSCFFMPCAPQSITDEDQLQPLVVGLALLLGFDLLPVIWRKVKARYAERKEFVRDTERRVAELQMRRRL
ncbi:uncharacterized protein N7483_001904 [Penicillium malachiteum]|uniref:uncharacterized protein n=1 Tax=Penicillium malachiteum TaxID=1324776 RepID=UPI00254718DE|nr:uncharacterized protein N7483_001904 [Penicillium malachiteum]KAJ5736779.1 hypothetical protein N7483_001904 [Penicillium malachiteum]